MYEANQRGKNVISSLFDSKLNSGNKKTRATVRRAYDGKWTDNARKFKKVIVFICRMHHFIIETCFDSEISPNSMFKMINCYV